MRGQERYNSNQSRWPRERRDEGERGSERDDDETTTDDRRTTTTTTDERTRANREAQKARERKGQKRVRWE